jgi:hypothetical protein
MNIILKIIIFLVILILYLNINRSLYKINTLNCDEIYYKNRSNLLEILYFKTPSIIYNLDISINKLDSFINNMFFNIYSNDSYDSDNINKIKIIKTVNYKNLIIDKSNNYISFNNTSYIDKDMIIELKKIENKFLPEINWGVQKYDIILGNIFSSKIYYELIYQYNFFYLIDGSIELYLIDPKHSLDLKFYFDYKNMNKSLIDISNKMINNFNYKKIAIEKKQAFHIPYGWIYMIEYKEPTKILNFSYSNVFDIFANFKIYFVNYINKYIV